MTPQDANEVLKMAARFDRRTIGAEDIKLWCAVLLREKITAQQAIRAVVDHYTNRPDDYLGVGHVVQAVKAARSRGLAKSAAYEMAALRAIDPDSPDYMNRAITAIRTSRARAAQGDPAPSYALALPSGYAGQTAPSSSDKRRRVREFIAAEIAAHPPKGCDWLNEDRPEGVSETLQAARDRAAAEKATRWQTESDVNDSIGSQAPMAHVGEVVGDVSSQIRSAASATP